LEDKVEEEASAANQGEEDSRKDHPEAEEHLKFLYNSIVSLESMLLEEHRSVWSPKIWSQESPSITKNVLV